MIKGIGIDLIEVSRMERWLCNTKLLEKYFHKDELLKIDLKGNGAQQSLAARFAAKEAFGKALGTGLANISLKDIMITNDNNGKPELNVYHTAKEALEKSGANRIHLSLTHEKNNAIAMVVLEKD